MNILITGGAGYIGSQISYKLSDDKIKHSILDNFSTGNKKLLNPEANFFNLNFGDKKNLKRIISEKKINCIIHLAASISVPESMKNPQKYYQNNVINLINLLDVCKETKIKYFIFSSTASIYGETTKSTVSENDIKNPTNIYGKTKLIGEELIKYYSKKIDLNYAILRFFNVIGADSWRRTGPILNQGHLFGNILENIKKKNFKVTIFGNKYLTKDGTGIRDYIDVEDIAQIHIDAIKLVKDKKKSYILNCGNSLGYSVYDIIRNFEKLTKKKFSIKIKKPRPGDVAKVVCNNKKIKKVLKLKKKKSMLKSIEHSIKWKLLSN